jgi:hypothetical protein
MANKTVITFGIYLRPSGHPIGPGDFLANPGLAVCFAHVARRRDLSPRVGNLANFGPDAATWATWTNPWAAFWSCIECRWSWWSSRAIPLLVVAFNMVATSLDKLLITHLQ